MTIPLLLTLGAMIITFFVFRSISEKSSVTLNSLEKKRIDLESRYKFMVAQRASLKKEITKKRDQLDGLRLNQRGIKTINASDINGGGGDDTEKISSYLLKTGSITLEQNESVLKKMATLKMDYLGICVTLGYIDIETAKQAAKANSIAGKSVGIIGIDNS